MPKAHTLMDDFNDNVIDTVKWSAFGNPAPASERIGEVNGRVEIRPRSGDSGAFSGYRSTLPYDLTNSQVHVELIQPLPDLQNGITTFAVGATGNNDLYFTVELGKLECWQSVSSTRTQLESVPYDPVAHRWLRLRERLGTAFWETSPNGTEWTVLFSKPRPINPITVNILFQAGSDQAIVSPGMAIFDNLNTSDTSLARRVEERRQSARAVRDKISRLAEARPHPEHANNNDEVNYADRPFIGNYSKSLKHDSVGDPDPISYGTLLRALESRDPGDFEEIRLGLSEPGIVKLTNPQSGLTFEVGGPDPQEITLPPAPRFDSEQTAHEMGELYWMALARDIPFANWATQATTTGSVIQRAINSLNSEFPAYGGARPVTAQTLFRGIYPGEQIGPYVSQFLLKGNVDQRKGNTLAAEGFISYGVQVIYQQFFPASAGVNFLTDFTNWLDVQNGLDTRGNDSYDFTRRFLRDLRGGATWVHFDQVLNAFYNAAWILMSEPSGNQSTVVSGTTGRPQIDLEFPLDRGNAYDPPGTAMDSRTQSGFATFGPIHLLQVLGEVLGRALRAMWWQKWGVHRRLRPEEYGGRVHNHLRGARTYPLHSSILTSFQSGLLSNYFNATTGRLLPQAYPEGAPTHPAYGSGHAVGAGACATILKAFFDESKAIENPVQARADGLALLTYTGADAAQMTVGGELNKLAGNIAIFRNAAGVHWRTDYSESLPFGEEIAIGLLQEMSLGFNEDSAFFELTRFNGQKIRIFDGKVVPVVSPS